MLHLSLYQVLVENNIWREIKIQVQKFKYFIQKSLHVYTSILMLVENWSATINFHKQGVFSPISTIKQWLHKNRGCSWNSRYLSRMQFPGLGNWFTVQGLPFPRQLWEDWVLAVDSVLYWQSSSGSLYPCCYPWLTFSQVTLGGLGPCCRLSTLLTEFLRVSLPVLLFMAYLFPGDFERTGSLL